jgi:hypothetical protein
LPLPWCHRIKKTIENDEEFKLKKADSRCPAYLNGNEYDGQIKKLITMITTIPRSAKVTSFPTQ